mgnify:CR=1 FL=1
MTTDSCQTRTTTSSFQATDQGCIHGFWKSRAKVGKVHEGRLSVLAQGKLSVLVRSGAVSWGWSAHWISATYMVFLALAGVLLLAYRPGIKWFSLKIVYNISISIPRPHLMNLITVTHSRMPWYLYMILIKPHVTYVTFTTKNWEKIKSFQKHCTPTSPWKTHCDTEKRVF